MDYILLNKIELGLRLPPPLEGIMALADALDSVKPLGTNDFEQLLDLAAEPNKNAGPRFTSDELQRIKESKTASVFFTRRVRAKGDE